MELAEVIKIFEKSSKTGVMPSNERTDEILRQLKLAKCLRITHDNQTEQIAKLKQYEDIFKDPYFKGLTPEDVRLLAKSSLRARKECSDLIEAITDIQQLLQESKGNDDKKKKAIEICKKHNPYVNV